MRLASERLLAFAGNDGTVARMGVVRPPRRESHPTIGRYVLGPKIATGGMASVHLGRLQGPAGFARTVAIKRLLPELVSDPEFVARFVDEARIASRISHTNVVPTLDVVDGPEVLLVLEYVHGESLARLLHIAAQRGQRCPPSVASAIVIGVLRGLHVAHEAKGAHGVPLELVHRDVSPQNVLVGSDGAPRILDFGIARAAGREQSTFNRAKGASQVLRGKLAYMAPEQVSGEPLDRRADLFAAGVMLWETLAAERLFKGEDAVRTMDAIFHRDPPPLSNGLAEVSSRVDEVLATALAKDASQRFSTANEMARAIEIALPPGSDREVADWVDEIASEILAERTAVLAFFEGSTEDDEEHDPADPTTERRAALMPCELPPVRDEAKTVPGFDVEAHEPIRTPMSMVSPLEQPDPLGERGMSATRIGLLEFDPNRAKPMSGVLRTPIPMPAPEIKPNMSIARLAALILVPPAIAAMSIFVIRPATITPAAAHAPIAVTAEAALVPPPLPPVIVKPPLAAKVTAASPATSAAAPPRGHHHPRAPLVRPPRKR